MFQQNVEDVYAGDFVPFLWAFIDADARSTVPEKLAGFHTNRYIISPPLRSEIDGSL